jgi:glucosyl-3-phosphoglycerate synthase
VPLLRKAPASSDRSTSRRQARQLAEAKGARTVSVCIPARNEEDTVGRIVSAIRRDLVEAVGLVDEVVVMDHASQDATAAIAERAGARVVSADDVATEFGPALGKGDVLWRSLQVSRGDIIVWVDADLEAFTSDYVVALVRPLLVDPKVALVKATYNRVLGGQADEGGRVTELTARPALRLQFPELSHIRQPLGGEYAIRRHVAERIAFEVDYGVEVGLLIDVAELIGPGSVAQVDLGTRRHRNRPLRELHEQATQVLRAVLDRSGGRPSDDAPACRPPVGALARHGATALRPQPVA